MNAQYSLTNGFLQKFLLDKSKLSYDEEKIQHEANKLIQEDKLELSDKPMNRDF